MCRALKVTCVAADGESLAELKSASVGAVWELTPGATSADAALDQIAEYRSHVLVVFGPFGGLVRSARAKHPTLRVVADRDWEGADVTVGSLDEVRDAIVGLPKPGGPVRA